MRRRLVHLALLLAVLAPLPAESLFKAETLAEGTLYSDQVARKNGDLITIKISETTAVSESRKASSKREQATDVGIDVLPGSNRLASTGAASGSLPALKFDSKNDFKGEGKLQQNGSMTATLTARVIDVLDNGNLLIEGRRTIKVQDDTKTIILTGICRTADITKENVVLSEKLHNFQVAIEGEGPLTRSQQQGWLSRLLDVIWPL